MRFVSLFLLNLAENGKMYHINSVENDEIGLMNLVGLFLVTIFAK